MRATLGAWGATTDLIFTPHLLPIARGILSTIVAPLASPLTDPLGPLRDAYGSEPFIELSSDPPALRDVTHRNVARISATMLVGARAPTLVITCAIDNLLKGAAGQAVQNANVMFGLAETSGLPA